MKISKLFRLLLIAILSFSCSSDDDNGNNAETFSPTITLDVATAITRPSGADITDLIDFGQGAGVSASDYQVNLDVGDRLRLGVPQGLAANTILYYSRVDYFEENPNDPGVFDIPVDDSDVVGVWLNYEFPDTANFVDDPFITSGAGQIFSEFDIVSIDADVDDIDYKYDIRVVIEQDGTFYGYYFIDPKIRIKSLN